MVKKSHKRRVNGRQSALSEEIEKELMPHILKFEELLLDLPLHELAYNIVAADPHIPNPFNTEKKTAGKKWYYAFMSMHNNVLYVNQKTF